MTRYEALMKCINAAGSQAEFGRAIGVAQPTVWRWEHQSKQLPPEHVLTAERLYGVSRHDLRPDIYPREHMVDQASGTRFMGVDRHAGRHPSARTRLVEAG